MAPESQSEGSEDVSSWKNKHKDLQERFTKEVTQAQTEWRLRLKEAEEKKTEPESLYLPSKGREKKLLQNSFGELEETDHPQNGRDRRSRESVPQIRELEGKVMQMEKGNFGERF